MRAKPQDQKTIHLLVCYEEDRSGETLATQKLAGEFKKIASLQVKAVMGPTLKESTSLAIVWWHLTSLFFWAKTLIQQKHLDIIYTTTYAIGIPAIILKNFYGFKVIYHHHGPRIPEKLSWSSTKNIKVYITQRVKYGVISYLHTLFFKTVDVVLVPSQYTKGQLLKLFPGLTEKRLYVIDNGVNTNQFFPKGKVAQFKLRRAWGIPKKDRVVLYVGSLHTRKRVDGIIRIFSKLAKNGLYHLIIAHPNTKDEESAKNLKLLKNLTSKLGVASKVLVLKNPKRLNDIYNFSDITILFSRQEHFPLVALEALAAGSLFVATPVGNLKSLLTRIDKRLILSTNVNAASGQIKNILNLSDLQKAAIRKKGLELVKSYRWGKIAIKLLTTIEKGLDIGN